VCIDANDLNPRFANPVTRSSPFVVWVRESSCAIHGMDIEDGVPTPGQVRDFDAW